MIKFYILWGIISIASFLWVFVAKSKEKADVWKSIFRILCSSAIGLGIIVVLSLINNISGI